MAYLVVNGKISQREEIHSKMPFRPPSDNTCWFRNPYGDVVPLPKGSIAKLIGRELMWEDEPYKLME